MRRVGLLVAIVAVAVVLILVSGASGRTDVLFAQMTPDQVNPPGPPEGRARVALQVDDEKNYVCYLAQWDAVGEPTGLHVHKGLRGTVGPLVIDLRIAEFNDSGCMNADHGVLVAIMDDPGGHYVDIHTDSHPNGAARGQLEGDPDRQTPPGPHAPPPATTTTTAPPPTTTTAPPPTTLPSPPPPTTTPTPERAAAGAASPVPPAAPPSPASGTSSAPSGTDPAPTPPAPAPAPEPLVPSAPAEATRPPAAETSDTGTGTENAAEKSDGGNGGGSGALVALTAAGLALFGAGGYWLRRRGRRA